MYHLADYDKMLEHIDSAMKSLELAEASMLPVNALKQLDAYLLGHMRCTKTCLQETRKAITSSARYRKRKKKEETSE